jgi:hypothetical protein
MLRRMLDTLTQIVICDYLLRDPERGRRRAVCLRVPQTTAGGDVKAGEIDFFFDGETVSTKAVGSENFVSSVN